MAFPTAILNSSDDRFCLLRIVRYPLSVYYCISFPQCRAAAAGIKIPSVENTELKGSPFKASWMQVPVLSAHGI